MRCLSRPIMSRQGQCWEGESLPIVRLDGILTWRPMLAAAERHVNCGAPRAICSAQNSGTAVAKFGVCAGVGNHVRRPAAVFLGRPLGGLPPGEFGFRPASRPGPFEADFTGKSIMSTMSHSGPQSASSRSGASRTTAGLPSAAFVAELVEPRADSGMEQVFEKLPVRSSGLGFSEDAPGDGGAVDLPCGVRRRSPQRSCTARGRRHLPPALRAPCGRRPEGRRRVQRAFWPRAIFRSRRRRLSRWFSWR